MDIRRSSSADDPIIVEHYMALWDSYGTPQEHYRPDAHASIAEFLRDGREHRALQTFVASIDGEAAGSAGCELHRSPYPTVIQETYRRFGYVWHVFVRPEFQKRGIGRALTETAIEYLRGIGCTTITLNASEAGAPLYRSLGFATGSEMRLKLGE